MAEMTTQRSVSLAIPAAAPRMQRGGSRRQAGFTLIELVIAVCIAGILAAIAYPSYINSVTKTRRSAAATCLSSFATQMERFYTSNLRYDEDLDGDDMNTAALQALNLDCASAQNTGEFYTYSFAAGQPQRATYTILATPKDIQAERDTDCGALSVTHTGTRGAAEGTVDQCW